MASDPGTEQRAGDPLQGPGADQELIGGGDRAEGRGRAEGDSPITKMRRRPNWSPRLPPTNSSETRASM